MLTYNLSSFYSIPRFKQRFSIIVSPINNIIATLDAAKVANTVLFVASATNMVDETIREEILDAWGNKVIVSCLGQGLPNTIVAVTNVNKLSSKVRFYINNSLLYYFYNKIIFIKLIFFVW